MEQRVSERVDERQTRHYKLILFVVRVFYTIIMNVICCRKGAGGIWTHTLFSLFESPFPFVLLTGLLFESNNGGGGEWEGGICGWVGGGGGNGVQD